MFINGMAFMNAACCSPDEGDSTDPGTAPRVKSPIWGPSGGDWNQGAETCTSTATVLPDTCSTYPCARTVRRVHDSCASFFSADSFSAATRDRIAALDETCAASVAPPARVLGFQGLAGQTVSDPCGVTLTDGLDMLQARDGDVEGLPIQAPGLLLDETMGVLFEAPPGRVLQLDFDQLWLPPGLVLTVYDGFDRLSPVLDALTSKPDAPLVTSDWLLYVESSFAPTDFDATVVAKSSISFSVRMTCKCSDPTPGSCGAHGVCVQGVCHCNSDFSGDFCDVGPEL